MTYWTIRLMALCGLAYAIKLPRSLNPGRARVARISDRRNGETELVGAAN